MARRKPPSSTHISLILQDPDLIAHAHQNIYTNRQNAAFAWRNAAQQVAASYRALEDAYLQQRAADVEDVQNQVLFALAGKTSTAKITFKEPVILFAQDITPTETAQLDMDSILEIMTVGGGPTSDSAILARPLGYGDVVAHVMSPETRQFYDLEGLWADAPRVRVEG